MAAFYRIASQYQLRGWEKLPYALVDARTGNVSFLPKPKMDTLLKCDGSWDFDSPLTPDQDRTFAAELLSKGRIEACAPGTGLNPDQHYRFFPNRFMRSVQWSITGGCNYRCKHCFMSAPDARYDELSHESVMEIARQIAGCGIHKVSLTGGEPLVRPDFLEIAAELTQLGITITHLNTNGALLSPHVLEGLADLGQKPDVVISFDGVGFHDWMRGIDGAERAANAAFELCAEKGFRSIARMCLCRDNLGAIRKTVNHLATVGCSRVRVGRVSNAGEWLHNGDGLTPTIEEYFEAVLRYIPQYYEDGMPLPVALSGVFSASPEDPDHYSILSYRPGHDHDDDLLLACARSMLQIYPDGRPAICDVLGPDFVGMPSIARNEFDQQSATLQEVLSTGSAYMELMDMHCSSFKEHNAKCRECPYLRLCGGGCRASAYLAGGTIFGKDPDSCAFFFGGLARRVIDAVHAARPEASTSLADDQLVNAI